MLIAISGCNGLVANEQEERSGWVGERDGWGGDNVLEMCQQCYKYWYRPLRHATVWCPITTSPLFPALLSASSFLLSLMNPSSFFHPFGTVFL
jgi:hypothetical protein